ncbi:MAG: ABC transporter ATP-binding protein, partial [Eubacterium sp.]
KGCLFNELSGGEKQRVIIARAIAQEPDIILLDEPTSALDVHHQIEVMELIQELNEKNEMTVVAVLHDLNLAARFCKRLIMIKGGQVVADGRPKDVIVEGNLKLLYNMKMFIRENTLFDKPEVIPVRVLNPKKTQRPLHIHVICGGSGASKIIEELDDMGHRVTAGVINEGSDDWLICKSLNLEIVEEKPFTGVSMDKQKENLKMMADADIVLIADVPFGQGNINNLVGLDTLDADIFLHTNCLNNNFTGKHLSELLDLIKKKKTLIEIGDHDEFIELLNGRCGGE